VKQQTNFHKLAAALRVDPMDLLRMINGRSSPSKAIVAGLATELDSDPRFLEKLADEIRKDLG
jgi:transcriptional regulator with XRE-family HTH domain